VNDGNQGGRTCGLEANDGSIFRDRMLIDP